MSAAALARQQLDDIGFLVLDQFMSTELLDGLRQRIAALFAEEGEKAGSEFKQEAGSRRLANVVDKGDIFQQVITAPDVLKHVENVLGAEFKLSSLNVRSVNPRWDRSQPLHADMAAIADEKGYWVCNTVWMLDDITEENGAIRVVPGSHRWRMLPQDALRDPGAPHPQEILVTGKAGTVVVMNAHMWHGGTGNRTNAPRTALHAFFCRRDKPQQQYQKKLLRPEVQDRLPARVREILALDDSWNDQLSAQVAVRSGFMN